MKIQDTRCKMQDARHKIQDKSRSTFMKPISSPHFKGGENFVPIVSGSE